MVYKILVSTLFLFSALNHIQTTDCVSISAGVYPNYAKYGINLRTCGLSYVSTTLNRTRSPDCFLGSPGNISLAVSAGRYPLGDKISSRIFKGKVAKDGESPWTVLLELIVNVPDPLNPSGFQTIKIYCTGSLITLRWVLTAANCTVIPKLNISCLVGINVVAGRANRIRTAKLGNIKRHPYFTEEQDSVNNIKYDIALIKLDSDFELDKDEFNFYLNTICLPNDVLQTDERQIATLSGWGAISETVSKPNKLQISTIRIPPGELCSDKMLICAEIKRNKPRPCYGDSGGPLYQFSSESPFFIQRAVQIGVYRGGGYRGVGSCKAGHTRKLWVPPMLHIEFILHNIEQNN